MKWVLLLFSPQTSDILDARRHIFPLSRECHMKCSARERERETLKKKEGKMRGRMRDLRMSPSYFDRRKKTRKRVHGFGGLPRKRKRGKSWVLPSIRHAA